MGIATVVTGEGILEITGSGDLALPALLQAMEKAREAYPKMPARRLWDLRDATLAVTSAELKEVADHASARLTTATHVALVGTDDVTYSLGRMYGVFRASLELDVRPFRDRDAALQWLRSAAQT